FPRRASQGGMGCIKAASRKNNDHITICRWKSTEPGDSELQEKVGITVEWSHAGVSKEQQFETDRQHTSGVGNLIALSIVNRNGQSTVRAYSAGGVDSSWNPLWQQLAEENFASTMEKHGLVANRDVLFVGSRIKEGIPEVSDKLRVRPIMMCDLQL